MKLNFKPLKPWRISLDLLKEHSNETLEKIVKKLNRCCKKDFFFTDFHKGKFVLDPAGNLTSFGFPHSVVKTKGFDYYFQILDPSELTWLSRLFAATNAFFLRRSKTEREDWALNYSLVAQNSSGKILTLNHQLVPYEWCLNGNLWLGLCVVLSELTASGAPKACLQNQKTGMQYHFANGKFLRAPIGSLTFDEITILKLMSEDTNSKKILSELDISDKTLSRRKKSASLKLGTKTEAGTIRKAMELGLI